MRREPVGHPPSQSPPALEPHVPVEQVALLLPREREAHVEPLLVQPPHRPGHVLGGDALDEIRQRPFGEVVLELLHRPQRQAGPGRKVDVAHLGKVAQQHFRGVLARLYQRPGPPFARPPPAEPDVAEIRERGDEGGMVAPLHLLVDMDHHRAIRRRPMPRHLLGPVERAMHQHDEADGHAQFPFDISPRISSCRQLMYFSLHLHHSSGLSASFA